MRLLKIGRDASCDLVLHSDKVSSLHAEMTVLNNGDILLEDKNSRNGTFLMNKPIKAGTTVSVRRGDAIRFGYPQIYYSKRKMISSFKKQYNIDFVEDNLFIKEKTRSFYQPIYEDQNGTFIFAGKVFFPYKNLKEFYDDGMSMFIIDMSFIDTEKNIPLLVNEVLKGNKIAELDVDNYLLFEEMVNDYGK